MRAAIRSSSNSRYVAGRSSWSTGLTRDYGHPLVLSRGGRPRSKTAQDLPEKPGALLTYLAQETGEGDGKRLGLLHVGPVGSRLEHHQLRPLDLRVHDPRP